MSDDLTVTVRMTKAQADALVHACDLAYRVASGHWRVVAGYAGTHNTEAGDECSEFGHVGNMLELNKVPAFPKLAPGAHYGITSKCLHPDIVRLDAVGKQVRRAMAFHRKPEGDPLSVSFDTTMNWQPEGEPLPEVEVKP